MAHHEPLKALSPIAWSDVSRDNLKPFLVSSFSSAQTVIDSVPSPFASARFTTPPNRARSHTDGSISRSTDSSPAPPGAASAAAVANAEKLRKEWKEAKVPAKDNPLGVDVYKLSAKDGRGAWFARRSVHHGIPFDKFRLGLEREFGETMKAFEGPGTGNVRGIGAERRAERHFPGPTTPRDFVTLLLTGHGKEQSTTRDNRLKQYLVLSRPCDHPECAPRSGYIRGSYESVEIIREVPVEQPLRATRSSTDVARETIQLRKSEDNAEPTDTLSERAVSDKTNEDAADTVTAVEWIMVTRSDPGGSVPRFMVEKGTPGGIVNDAGRFIKWLESKSVEELENPVDDANGPSAKTVAKSSDAVAQQTAAPAVQSTTTYSPSAADQEPLTGLYSMITDAIGMAQSAVASRMPNFASQTGQLASGDDTTSYESDSDDSDQSFASAPEPDPLATIGDGDMASVMSGKSAESGSKASLTHHEKALKKLQERYRKLEEKRAKQQERNLQQKTPQGDDALAKLKEKHEKEIARQEENYRKETKKLEEKRLREEKKAEEKQRKQAEKDARNNIALELERTRVERDMALRQVDILREQVGELQAQNTKLVARLGKLEGDAAAREGSPVSASAKENGRVQGDAEKTSQES
ncbi:hypothetical protein BD289DRAFT_379457 [Coniella lustricola]|uniref:DUF3074 domain-containing protein n=1 Tax=Coniella lustricola TaxID=2025994 RepID=A0A2T2ZSM0_9PEZI|nr:hypothetical protein BD289DRAFT_379457 [Coniella lustricola]